MSRMLRKRKQNSADLAPTQWKFRLFTFTVASMQPPFLGLPKPSDCFDKFGHSKASAPSLRFHFQHMALMSFHEIALSKSFFTGIEKTFPILISSSNPTDPGKGVPLCLKLISVIHTFSKFFENLPPDKSEGAGLCGSQQGQTQHISRD